MITSILSDMDGVIYRGKALIDGAADFIERLRQQNIGFLFLTNASESTAADLQIKMERLGIGGLSPDNFMTASMATAVFLRTQLPGGRVYVIGGAGLAHDIAGAGLQVTEDQPDCVVVGKTKAFNFDMMKKAANFIRHGAKFIATNPDIIDPIEDGVEPACGSITASIARAAGREPYVVGKPNALMMMIARKKLGARSSETMMIGDRMDTDIIAGLEAGMRTALVLSGVTTRETAAAFSYNPDYIFNHVGEIFPEKL